MNLAIPGIDSNWNFDTLVLELSTSPVKIGKAKIVIATLVHSAGKRESFVYRYLKVEGGGI